MEPDARDLGAGSFVVAVIDPRVGLCSACAHSRRVVSGKGSTFWLCELATSDPRFRKYPPLPVLRCQGFEEKDEEDETSSSSS